MPPICEKHGQFFTTCCVACRIEESRRAAFEECAGIADGVAMYGHPTRLNDITSIGKAIRARLAEIEKERTDVQER